MKNSTLISILTLILCAPAFADIDKSASTATCDSATIGATSGTAYMDTDWTANTINLDFYSDGEKISTGSCTYDGAIELPEDPEDKTGYTFGGWQLRRAPAAPTLNLSSIIGTDAGASRAYVNASGNFSEDGASYGAAFYGLSTSDLMSFAVNYGNNGIIHGHARCSKTPGSNGWYTNGEYDGNNDWSNTTLLSSLTDETGQEGARYCYCQVDGYTPLNGTLQSVSSSWAFFGDDGGASYCAFECAHLCSHNLRFANSDSLAFRAAVLGSVQ